MLDTIKCDDNRKKKKILNQLMKDRDMFESMKEKIAEKQKELKEFYDKEENRENNERILAELFDKCIIDQDGKLF